jgi:hypothetical protein
MKRMKYSETGRVSPSTRVFHHLRGNVIGYVALFVALSGTAAAVDGPLPGQDQVGSSDIINSEVKTNDIGAEQVQNSDIAVDAVKGGRIGDDSVKSIDVFNDTLTGDDIDEGTLDSSVLQRRVSDSCPAGESIRAIDAAGTDVTCETVGGGGNPTGPAGGDLAGSSYPNPEIAADAVGSGEVTPDSLAAGDLAADSVGSSEIAANAVSGGEVLNNSLTASDLGIDSVENSELAVNSVGSLEVQSNSLLSSDIDEANLQGVGSANALENGADDLTPQELGAFTGTSFPSPCDPDAAFLSCGAVTLNLPASGSVLLQASGGFVGVGSGADTGTCEIREDSTTLGGNMTFGQAGSEHNTQSRADGFALSAFDTGNAAGAHTYALVCNTTAGDVQVHDPKMSAIFLF